MNDRAIPLLEIAANSVGSALAAQEGGAGRIELCDNLGEGGTTPSYGTLTLVRERLRIPIHVMIRPRGGDFLYDEAELAVMQRDIETCVRLGCDGVVLGALDADGAIDVTACRELIASAGSLNVTFHRAFDAAGDPAQALQDLIALGCSRVLTSGARESALQGADAIAAYVRQAEGHVRVIAGAGVTADNLRELATRTGAREFHASASSRHRSSMRYRNPQLQGLEADYRASDATQIRRMAEVLRSLTGQGQAGG
ncbi:copper homeostasis protein CutC [Dokdonella soli]